MDCTTNTAVLPPINPVPSPLAVIAVVADLDLQFTGYLRHPTPTELTAVGIDEHWLAAAAKLWLQVTQE